MRSTTPLVAVCLATAGCDPLQWGFPRVADPQTLVGFASLPADTFAVGPTSGQFINPTNGVTPPFVNRQPVQGFSSVLRASNGDFLVLPDNGFGAKATSADFVLAASRGFEGIALPPGGKQIYAMLESPIAGADPQNLVIHEFDLERRRYTGRQWTYRLDVPGHSVGDFTAVTDRLFVAVERDDAQGDAARFKKIFLVDLDKRDPSGVLVKHLVADLLNLADPDLVGGTTTRFRFPFQTIESVIPLGPNELGVLNDNNYPFSTGRAPDRPDPNEFILIRLNRPLDQYANK